MAISVEYKAKSGRTLRKPTLTYLQDLEQHSEGFCLVCGEGNCEATEHDAEYLKCEGCGENMVFGSNYLWEHNLYAKGTVNEPT